MWWLFFPAFQKHHRRNALGTLSSSFRKAFNTVFCREGGLLLWQNWLWWLHNWHLLHNAKKKVPDMLISTLPLRAASMHLIQLVHAFSSPTQSYSVLVPHSSNLFYSYKILWKIQVKKTVLGKWIRKENVTFAWAVGQKRETGGKRTDWGLIINKAGKWTSKMRQ